MEDFIMQTTAGELRRIVVEQVVILFEGEWGPDEGTVAYFTVNKDGLQARVRSSKGVFVSVPYQQIRRM